MKKRIQIGLFIRVIWLLGVVITVLLGVTPLLADESLNRIVATVDGEPITLHELRTIGKEAGERSFLAPQQGAAGMSDKDLLDALIMNRLVDKEVETQGLIAREGDITDYIERIKQQNNILSDEQFQSALASQGMEIEDYRKQVAKEIERALLVSREIGSRVNVTPQDVERYYQQHAQLYARPEQVRIRLISLPLSTVAAPEKEQEVVSQIQDIRNRALAGEEFAALATAHSQGPAAEQGGDMGYFNKGQMVGAIEDVAFALKPGEVSEPFRTDTAVHLLKVEERTEAGYQPMAEVSEEIKEKLYNEALRSRFERWFQEDLRFRHHVENFLVASNGAGAVRTGSSDSLFGSLDGDPSAEPLAPALDTTTEEETEKRGFLRRLWPF